MVFGVTINYIYIYILHESECDMAKYFTEQAKI